jgi:2-dehydropantoate 2-reductase
MKVCIVGAGAIGGFIGTGWRLAGQAQVSALARGRHAAGAAAAQGWRLRQDGQLAGPGARRPSGPADWACRTWW